MAPAAPCIELADHHQQVVGRRLNTRRQLGDGIAKDGGLGLTLQACRLVGEVRLRLQPFVIIMTITMIAMFTVSHTPMITPGFSAS